MVSDQQSARTTFNDTEMTLAEKRGGLQHERRPPSAGGRRNRIGILFYCPLNRKIARNVDRSFVLDDSAGDKTSCLPPGCCDQLAVQTVLGQQAFMRADFPYATRIEHDNLISLIDRAQAVGDNQNSAVLHQALDRVL